MGDRIGAAVNFRGAMARAPCQRGPTLAAPADRRESTDFPHRAVRSTAPRPCRPTGPLHETSPHRFLLLLPLAAQSPTYHTFGSALSAQANYAQAGFSAAATCNGVSGGGSWVLGPGNYDAWAIAPNTGNDNYCACSFRGGSRLVSSMQLRSDYGFVGTFNFHYVRHFARRRTRPLDLPVLPHRAGAVPSQGHGVARLPAGRSAHDADLDLGAFPQPIPPNLLFFVAIGFAASDFTAKPAWAGWQQLAARPLQR